MADTPRFARVRGERPVAVVPDSEHRGRVRCIDLIADRPARLLFVPVGDLVDVPDGPWLMTHSQQDLLARETSSAQLLRRLSGGGG